MKKLMTGLNFHSNLLLLLLLLMAIMHFAIQFITIDMQHLFYKLTFYIMPSIVDIQNIICCYVITSSTNLSEINK